MSKNINKINTYRLTNLSEWASHAFGRFGEVGSGLEEERDDFMPAVEGGGVKRGYATLAVIIWEVVIWGGGGGRGINRSRLIPVSKYNTSHPHISGGVDISPLVKE